MTSARWQELPLEKVADIHDNLREPVNAGERASRHGPYPYYGATGQVGWIDNFRQDGEYVLLGEDGAPFLDPAKDKAYLVSGKCWVNNHAHVLRGKAGVCINKFLLHALNGINYRGYTNGTTRLKLTQAAMRRLPIKLPPIDRQTLVVEKIEELFSELDASVAALKRAQANLKRYRAAVLKAAVEGRLTAQWRAERKAKGIATESAAKLLERILTERRKKWEAARLKKYTDAGKAPPKGWLSKYPEPVAPDTSVFPEMPEEWCWATVEQCATFENNAITDGPFGSNLKTEHYTDSGARVIRLQNIGDGFFVDERAYVAMAHYEKLRKHALKRGDIVIAMLGEKLPRACVVPDDIEPAIVKADCVKISPNRDVINSMLLNFQLNSEPVRTHESRNIKGVGRPRLNVSHVRNISIALPPINEQAEIVAQIEAKLSNIEQTETEIKRSLERASRLRQAILKRAFEGRLV